MASIFSHAIVATAIGRVVQPAETSRAYWLAMAMLSAIPDLDVIGFYFGVHYGDLLGHRGLSHSLIFAALLGGLTAFLLLRRSEASRWHLFACFFLAAASHGVLDAMTNGGLGVAFFSPFDTARLVFPFHPIQVSPIGVGRFFSDAGLAVIMSEMKWLWIPSAIVFATASLVRFAFRPNDPAGRSRAT